MRLMKLHIVVAVVAVAGAAACRSAEQQQAEQAAAAAQQAAQAAQQGAQAAAAGAQAAAAGAQAAAAGVQSSGQNAQQGAQQFAQGMQQLAQGLSQMQGQGETIPHDQLKAFLPETIAGWTRKSARSEQITMPFKISNAEARYENGAASMDVKITDALLNQLFLAPLSMFLVSGYEEKSDDGFKRYAALNGAPGFEEWQIGSKRGEVTVIVNKRFVVQATGHNVAGIEPVRAAVQAIDLGKLAAFK